MRHWDDLIVSVADAQWQKVAMIVARALRYAHLELTAETIGARVEALVA